MIGSSEVVDVKPHLGICHPKLQGMLRELKNCFTRYLKQNNYLYISVSY